MNNVFFFFTLLNVNGGAHNVIVRGLTHTHTRSKPLIITCNWKILF